MGPGQSELKRMPSRAWIMASSRVMARTAPLEAVYASWGVAAPSLATKEATLMTEPPRWRPFSGSSLFCLLAKSQRAGSWRKQQLTLRMAITAYLQPYQTPLTLMAWVRSQIFSSVLTASSSLGLAHRAPQARRRESASMPRSAHLGCMIPALLNCCQLISRRRRNCHLEFVTRDTWARGSRRSTGAQTSRRLRPPAPEPTRVSKDERMFPASERLACAREVRAFVVTPSPTADSP